MHPLLPSLIAAGLYAGTTAYQGLRLAQRAALTGDEVVSANVHKGLPHIQEWAVDQVTAPICQGTNSFCP